MNSVNEEPPLSGWAAESVADQEHHLSAERHALIRLMALCRVEVSPADVDAVLSEMPDPPSA